MDCQQMRRASTKRLGNLIRSIKWSVLHIDEYLLNEADKEVKNLRQLGKRALCIWDGSVIEKPESSKLEGLGPVISSKAKRLNRSRRGLVFNPPATRPIMVTGMQWTGALIAGMEGIVKVAGMKWWTGGRGLCNKAERSRRRDAQKNGEEMGEFSSYPRI